MDSFLNELAKSKKENHQRRNALTLIENIQRKINDLTAIGQLIKWLLPRIKNTVHEFSYDQAAINLFNSVNKDIALYGILIRDTQVNERDLSLPGAAFRRNFSNHH